MSPETNIPYYHTDHGPEIFPRRLTLTTEEKQWRKEATSFLWERAQKIPASSPHIGMLRDPQQPYQVRASQTDEEAREKAKRKLRGQLTEILFTLRVINKILKVQHKRAGSVPYDFGV